MILSDVGIRAAIAAGDIDIDPHPNDDQFTTSSIDLFLGGGFKVWDGKRLTVPGLTPTLDLALQNYQATAGSYLIDPPLDADGAFVLPPGQFVMAVTREKINLRRTANEAPPQTDEACRWLNRRRLRLREGHGHEGRADRTVKRSVVHEGPPSSRSRR